MENTATLWDSQPSDDLTMKTQGITLAGTCFVAAVGAFLAFVWLTGDRLPERVATHFTFDGTPDGWMSRREHLWYMTGVGLGVPLLIVGAFLLVRKVPARFVNVPYREYWLAEERHPVTVAWLTRAGLWLGCGITLGMGALHELILRANERTPAELDSGPVMLVVAIMMGVVVLFMIAMVLHFHRPPRARGDSDGVPGPLP